MRARTDQEACDLLDNLVIASPCSIPWEAMTGDDRKRLCGGCSRHVHNISDMTKKEAERFLQENGTTHCMIFYRRFDGTIMTDDCPVGLRKIRNACKLAYRVAASFFVMLVSIPGALAQQLQTEKKQTADQTPGQCRQAKPTGIKHSMNRFGMLVDENWKEPAPPPGFYYAGNPAGGGMILRPLSDKSGNNPLSMPVPGQAIAVPIPALDKQPLKAPDSCSNDTPLVIKKPSRPTKIISKTNISPGVETFPDSNPNLDTTAHRLYEKGLLELKAGNKEQARTFFQQALSAFDRQKLGDLNFRTAINSALRGTSYNN